MEMEPEGGLFFICDVDDDINVTAFAPFDVECLNEPGQVENSGPLRDQGLAGNTLSTVGSYRPIEIPAFWNFVRASRLLFVNHS